jgi:hypothetical protein
VVGVKIVGHLYLSDCEWHYLLAGIDYSTVAAQIVQIRIVEQLARLRPWRLPSRPAGSIVHLGGSTSDESASGR